MKRFPLVALMSATPFASFAQESGGGTQPHQPISSGQAPSVASPQIPPAIPANMPDPEVLFFVGIPEGDNPEDVITYSRRLYVRTVSIQDPVLRQIIRIALAKLEDDPSQAKVIRAEYLLQASDYFYRVAVASLQQENVPGAGNAVQIAVRCNPANVQAQLLYANMLHVQLGKTDEAIKTLQHGLNFIAFTDPGVGDYVHRYFQLLESQQRDHEVWKEATDWLKRDGLSTHLREILALHAATAANWVGDYAEAVRLIQQNGLGKISSARLLQARAYFYGGNSTAGISVLDKAIYEFKGAERDAILSQLCRFHAELGQIDMALSVSQQRINEFPDNPQPRVHRLYLLDATGRRDAFNRELRDLLAGFSTKQAAMLPLATFAAERGHPNIAQTCYDIANSQPGGLSQQSFNRQLFASLYIESLIRARRPQEAIAAYLQMVGANRLLFRDSEGTIYAIVAAAYLATGDPVTGRGYLEEFLTERREDPETTARVKALEERRDGVLAPDGSTLVRGAATFEERRAISDEIKRISRRPRKIAASSYLATGRLLRHVEASQDALRILEEGVRNHPGDAQLKADYISVRIVCHAVEKYGYRKDLATEVEELLTMRRPSPRVWTEVARWLESDKTIAAPQAIKLRAEVPKLERPELKGLDIFGG